MGWFGLPNDGHKDGHADRLLSASGVIFVVLLAGKLTFFGAALLAAASIAGITAFAMYRIWSLGRSGLDGPYAPVTARNSFIRGLQLLRQYHRARRQLRSVE